MALFDGLFGGKKKETTPAAMTQPSVIKAYDQFGREVRFEREIWRKQILPESLRTNWSDPGGLYAAIVQALGDGFSADLKAAARHLQEIDSDRERGASVYAIVLMENGDLDGAERVLSAALEKAPRSGALLTNLAKVYSRRGNVKLSNETLWRALEGDPNFENALLWFAAIEKERGGEAAYTAALQRIAALNGSWRANLWLARQALDAKDLQKAISLYERVLIVAADAPGVLMQISGDLGKHGHVTSIIPLVLPFYDPKRHDLTAGLNLLQAFLETGDREGGEKLLHELMLLDLPPYREPLMRYSSMFAEIKAKAPAIEPIGELHVAIIPLDEPVWTNGLGSVDWLLPDRTPSSRNFAVLAFTMTVEASPLVREDEVIVGREDKTGRLTRSIPLHLTEVLRFRTDASPITFMPVVTGKGMAVMGKEWDSEAIARCCGDKCSHALTGHIAVKGDDLHLQLILWKTGDPKPTARMHDHGTAADLPAIHERCETELLAFLSAQKLVAPREPAAVFRPPSNFREYLEGLGQLFALALSRWEKSDTIYGERNIHRWMLALALNDESSPVAKIGLAAALANSRRRGSNVYRELMNETLAVFAKVPPTEHDTYRFTPAVFRLFGRMDEFEKRRNELMADADERYIRWLASLDTLFDDATVS